MQYTHYKDPAGLDDTGHSSALDLAKLMSTLTNDQKIQEVGTTAQTTVTDVQGKIKHELRNSNRLVADYLYDGAEAGKTGFTPAAGHCLVGTAKRNGTTLIAVILSTYSEDKAASAEENRKLLDWGFTNFSFL